MKIINIVSVNKQVNPQEKYIQPPPFLSFVPFPRNEEEWEEKELEALDHTDLQD